MVETFGATLRFAFIGGCLGAGTITAFAAGEAVISQNGQMFRPGSVSLEKGQPLVIVNDDGTTIHHAYVETDTFGFDSGDQIPGQKAVISFPATGRYVVLCGIHPKMKLDVTVR